MGDQQQQQQQQQRKSMNSGEPNSPPAPQQLQASQPTGATTESTSRSPLTTAASHYGTMEFNDVVADQRLASQREERATATRPPEAVEEKFAASVQVDGAPRPAIRRKIQQAKVSGVQGGASGKMSAINETIQVIDEQRSSLARPSRSARAVAAAAAHDDDDNEGQRRAGAPPIALSMKPHEGQPDEAATAAAADDDCQRSSANATATRPYPRKVLFIIANEFCERFSYYGLRTVLVLYFRSVLGFSDSGSTISFHLFATLCYLTPILGAILGDSVLGKYKTILYLSIVYFLGELVLLISSIFWDLGMVSVLVTWLGLLLIGIGTGGIKPCVAAFAGDQFLANETKWRESFFSLFYGAINLGSLISMFLTPLLRSNYACVGRNDCYPYAFGLPCLLIFIATAVFLLAHNHYYIAPLPRENVILAFCQCTWLAIKRKMAGLKVAPPPPPPPSAGESKQINTTNNQLVGHINYSLTRDLDDGLSSSPTSSRLSMSSSENEAKPVVAPALRGNNQLVAAAAAAAAANAGSPTNNPPSKNHRRSHWLYLASDRFAGSSIEEFRAVLGLLLLFLPTPVYWCLFDQQGSLWTLQAARMDGRILGTRFVLEPDQMMVANPLLLLTAIPIFQLLIYPALDRCHILTTPIQRMTTGGLIAALSFVASALIEFHVQASQPQLLPAAGSANLLLVNGLSECSLLGAALQLKGRHLAGFDGSRQSLTNATGHHLQAQRTIGALEPFKTRLIDSLPVSNSTEAAATYKLTFKLTDRHQMARRPSANTAPNQTTTAAASGHRLADSSNPITGCPFDPSQENELNLGALPDQAVRLLYLDQGNGRLTYKLFNESLALPQANKARVRLLYEFFGSHSGAHKRAFYLMPIASNSRNNKLPLPSDSKRSNQFTMSTREGQVLLSDYLDVELTPSGDHFLLYSNDSSLNLLQAQPIGLKLQPGTRNLLILHQMDANSVQLKQELLQDNKYRVSMLYQLIPYTMISMSEVMFSITGLEFSYAMAPPNLKSLILGAWSLTTAMGNILTVAVESWHPFSNMGHDFLFYAALMAANMVLFAMLGYQYEPYEPYKSKSLSQSESKSRPSIKQMD